MANPTMKTQEIVDLMMSNLGQNMSEDIMYQWFEELYRMIREEKWAWNWHWDNRVTLAPVIDSTNTYTWTAGDDFITSNAASPVQTQFPHQYTGRKFYLDERLYTAVDLGGQNANRIYFDRPLHTTQATPFSNLKLCRQDYSYKTSSIKTVEVDSLKKASTVDDDYIRDFLVTRAWTDAGTPIVYKCDDSDRLPTPVGAPDLLSTAAVAFEAGTYQYFWTFYDKESGLISKPGPTLLYNATVNQRPTFRYRNAANTTVAEGLSYELLLWRSKVDAERSRAPMFFIGAKSPLSAASNVQDTYATSNDLVQNSQGYLDDNQYYDGPWTTIDLNPSPDSIYSLDVLRLNNWGHRPHRDLYVDLGRNNAVLELLRFGLHQLVELQNRDSNTFRGAVVQFRQQMAYLLKQSRTAASDDPGVGRHRDYKVSVPHEDYDPTKMWHWKG